MQRVRRFRAVESYQAATEAEKDKQRLRDYVGDELAERFLSMRSSLKAPYSDLYYWLKQKPQELQEYLDSYQSHSSKKRKEKEGATLIYSKGGWKVLRIDTYDAAKYYGSHTKWCITGGAEGTENNGEYYFNDYKENIGCIFYFVISPTDNKWCYLDVADDMYDANVGEYFWDATDCGLRLEAGCIPKEIPREVLDALPNFSSRYLDEEALVRIAYVYKGGEVLPQDVDMHRATIAPKVTVIEEYAFANCTQLTFIDIPEWVVKIDDYAFENCYSLVDVTIPNNVKILGKGIFSGCEYMERLVIGDGVKEVSHILHPGQALHILSIGKGVQYINPNQLMEFNNLSEFTVSPENRYYKTIDNVLYSKEGKKLLYCPESIFFKKRKFLIPDGVEEIEDFAFFYDKEEECKISVPSTVIEIGPEAFNPNCSRVVIYCRGTKEECSKLRDKLSVYGNIEVLRDSTCKKEQ